MSKKIKFEDIKAGDTIRVTTEVKVTRDADPHDRSLHTEKYGWAWFEKYGEASYVKVEPRLIPADAEYVSISHDQDEADHELLRKKDGKWLNGKGETAFTSTKKFANYIKTQGVENSVNIFDVRNPQ